MSNLWITPEELGEYEDTEFSYEAAKSASYLLWALSGRKYSGVTTVTERYVCAGRTYRYGPSVKNNDAVLIDGDVYNIFSDNLDFYEDIATDGTRLLREFVSAAALLLRFTRSETESAK